MPVWRYVRKEVRDRYERRFGIKPPGYRGTGAVHWFAAWHPDEAPCCKCGQLTDRFVIGSFVFAKSPHPAYWSGVSQLEERLAHIPKAQRELRLSLCIDAHSAFCWPCERRAAIAVLQQRQDNPALPSELKASERVYMAALLDEERNEAGVAHSVCVS